MSDPKPGWTIEAAVQLLRDGYTPDQVERMTGFHARHVAAQAAALEKQGRVRPNVVVRPPEAARPETAGEAGKSVEPEEPFWPDV